MSKYFYITTTLPYVNAEPHIGFALELIQADVLARHHQQIGEEVIFNTGTDEHGLKIYRAAQQAGLATEHYVDAHAARFNQLKTALNVSFTNFIRTTDPHHQAAAQAFWQRCLANGDIYKKAYQIKYCVGCELEKSDSELINDHCPLHPNLTIEEISEENYFFRFSAYQTKLLALYDRQPQFVLPNFRFNEIKKFVGQGLHDFSISRLRSKLPWGVPVPDDPEQVMYVWFDALVSYISTLDWPNETTYAKFWPGLQIAGKDNLRQQAAIWQAMLLSAGLPPSRQILIHGFITVDGQKISKSLGNTVDPLALTKRYGIDPVRYYLLREIPSNEDGDFSEQRLLDRYQSDLANNLGNLVSRITKLIETKLDGELILDEKYVIAAVKDQIKQTQTAVQENINVFKLHEAIGQLWDLFSYTNGYIDSNKPWSDPDPSRLLQTLTNSVALLIAGSKLLWPFLPETAEKIYKVFGQDINSPNHTYLVIKTESLFPRLTDNRIPSR